MKGGFYSTKGPLGFCSNFFRAPINLDGETWRTTEHYYQAQKCVKDEDYFAILAAETPKEAARIGRSVEIIPEWDEIKYDVMLLAVRNKFHQHPELAAKLRATGDIELVEDTVGSVRPDAVWGNGADGSGKNWLGKILMQVRKELE